MKTLQSVLYALILAILLQGCSNNSSSGSMPDVIQRFERLDRGDFKNQIEVDFYMKNKDSIQSKLQSYHRIEKEKTNKLLRNSLLGSLLLLLLIPAIVYSVPVYNQITRLEEQIPQSLSDLQSTYRRRAELLPNLINTVKLYIRHEHSTLVDVIMARAKATAMVINMNSLDKLQLEEFIKAQNAISGSIARLLALSEQYPALKADRLFVNLQSQFVDTENLINNYRQGFNRSVNYYNATIRRFPDLIIAGIFGFRKHNYLLHDPDFEKVPLLTL